MDPYKGKGIELQLLPRSPEGLSLEGSGRINSSEQIGRSLPGEQSRRVQPDPLGNASSCQVATTESVTVCSARGRPSRRVDVQLRAHITTGIPAIPGPVRSGLGASPSVRKKRAAEPSQRRNLPAAESRIPDTAYR